MDEPSGQMQGPVSDASGDEREPPFVAQVTVRRLGFLDRLLIWGVLIAIVVVLVIVMLPVALLVMVGVVAYVAAAMVRRAIARVSPGDSLEGQRRNVRVRKE